MDRNLRERQAVVHTTRVPTPKVVVLVEEPHQAFNPTLSILPITKEANETPNKFCRGYNKNA